MRLTWLAALILALATTTAAVPGAKAQQAPRDSSPLTTEDTAANREQGRLSMDYVRDAFALEVLRSCPAGSGAPIRANINRMIAARRAQFMEAVTDPYWRGRADGAISWQIYRRAMDTVEDVNLRRTVNGDSDCASANEHAARMLVR